VAVVAGLVDGLAVPAPVADEDVAAERTGAARQQALKNTSTMRVAAVAAKEGVSMTPKRLQDRSLLGRPTRGSAVMVQLQAVEGRPHARNHVRVDAGVAGGGLWTGMAEQDLHQA
jgi:hypothetical protein